MGAYKGGRFKPGEYVRILTVQFLFLEDFLDKKMKLIKVMKISVTLHLNSNLGSKFWVFIAYVLYRWPFIWICLFHKIRKVRYLILYLCQICIKISFTDKTSNFRYFNFNFCNFSTEITFYNTNSVLFGILISMNFSLKLVLMNKPLVSGQVFYFQFL